MFKTLQRICVFTGAVLAMTGGAMAQSTTPMLPIALHTSGMVGLTTGQTARLNVLNPGALAPAVATVCAAQLSFLNAQGTVLKTTSVTVPPGESMSYNLDRDVDLIVSDLRVQVRAVIAYTSNTCALLPTLEVFNDDTGRTQFVVGRFAAIPLLLTATP
jgi:hypothetical protein